LWQIRCNEADPSGVVELSGRLNVSHLRSAMHHGLHHGLRQHSLAGEADNVKAFSLSLR
jgi:hypothetical protein